MTPKIPQGNGLTGIWVLGRVLAWLWSHLLIFWSQLYVRSYLVTPSFLQKLPNSEILDIIEMPWIEVMPTADNIWRPFPPPVYPVFNGVLAAAARHAWNASWHASTWYAGHGPWHGHGEGRTMSVWRRAWCVRLEGDWDVDIEKKSLMFFLVLVQYICWKWTKSE